MAAEAIQAGGRGTRRGEQTRVQILDAAEVLFAQRGYDAAALEDIAGQVGIRAPAIFRHFDNKQALYEAVIDRLMEAFVAAASEERLRDAPLEALERFIDHNLDHPNFVRILQHAALANDERLEYVAERWLRPAMERLDAFLDSEELLVKSDEFSARSILMTFQTAVWGYVGLQHFTAVAFGVDPTSDAQRSEFKQQLLRFARGLLRNPEAG